MKENYDELFEAGNKAQLEKMIENEDEKDGWDCIDLDFAISEITNNLESLKRHSKAKNYDSYFLKENINLDEMIREKSANIANFTHMIIMNCDKNLRGKE